MTRFFTILFILCVLATAGVWYWKTQHPEGEAMSDVASAPAARGSEGATTESVPGAAQEAARALRKASRTQDLASLVSIVCSVLSGLGAVVSAWFSYLRYRHQKRLAARA